MNLLRLGLHSFPSLIMSSQEGETDTFLNPSKRHISSITNVRRCANRKMSDDVVTDLSRLLLVHGCLDASWDRSSINLLSRFACDSLGSLCCVTAIVRSIRSLTLALPTGTPCNSCVPIQDFLCVTPSEARKRSWFATHAPTFCEFTLESAAVCFFWEACTQHASGWAGTQKPEDAHD